MSDHCACLRRSRGERHVCTPNDVVIITPGRQVALKPGVTISERGMSILGELPRAPDTDPAGVRRLEAERIALEVRLAAEPGRVDLRFDLAITHWKLFLAAETREEELRQLVLVFEQLEPLQIDGEDDRADRLYAVAATVHQSLIERSRLPT